MRELLSRLLDSVAAGRSVAYCRLIETRGSTPQKAGAAMLVFSDGSQFGTLGGGCVEAEVKRRALTTLDNLEPELCSFQLDSDYGWDDGLICGGRMLVLVDPIASAADADYFACLHNALERGDACVEAVSFDASKSGLPTPSSYLADSAGNFLASRPADAATQELPSVIRQVLAEFTSPLHARVSAGVSYLPQRGRCPLLIVGGGHVGQAVATMAAELDFDVSVLDDRAEYVDRTRFPRAKHLIQGEIGATLDKLDITPDTYALIVTRGHNHDEEALFHLVNRGALRRHDRQSTEDPLDLRRS